MTRHTNDGFIVVELTPAFAASMQKLLPSVISYLRTQAVMYSQSSGDNQGISMREYCERSADGLEILNEAIGKGTQQAGATITHGTTAACFAPNANGSCPGHTESEYKKVLRDDLTRKAGVK